MSELLCVARLKIHADKLDEFKRLAAKCAELTSGLAPEVLQAVAIEVRRLRVGETADRVELATGG